jgi:sulfonate transport system permease protein
LTFLDAIPTLAWVPVLQQAAPSDEATIVMATVIGGALPLTIATVRGISQVDRHLYLSAKLLGASGRALWVVLVQSARPAIVAGLRNCVYQAARTVIGAEILTTADFGLGRLATYARQASSVGGVIVVATIIGSAVALVDTLVLRRLQLETERRWQTGGRRP